MPYAQGQVINFKTKESMTKNELLDKPVWQMTGEELLFLAQHGNTSPKAREENNSAKEERLYVYGLAGIARLFGCSLPTANRIKQSGEINRAITQVGRKIIVYADLALELAGRKTGGREAAYPRGSTQRSYASPHHRRDVGGQEVSPHRVARTSLH